MLRTGNESGYMTGVRTLYPFLLACVLTASGCGDSSRTVQRTDLADTLYAQEQLPSQAQQKEDPAVVLVMGNSLTAGYGLSSETQAFPALLQQRIDSLGWNVEVINAGVSGQTSGGGLSRVDWLMQQPVDVLILELGGNDGLRGIDPAVTRRNLQAIIDTARARHPQVRVILAGVRIPPNLGRDYTRRFYSVYTALADTNDLTFIPHLMEGVAGVPRLMQDDGIHPTAQGHRLIAQTVWERLRPVLEDMQEHARATAG